MTVQSRKIGDIEVTALNDGVLATSLDVVLGMDRAESERLAGKQAGDGVHIAVNAFLLKLQGKWALVDTGSGNTMGRTLGATSPRLRSPPRLIERACAACAKARRWRACRRCRCPATRPAIPDG